MIGHIRVLFFCVLVSFLLFFSTLSSPSPLPIWVFVLPASIPCSFSHLCFPLMSEWAGFRERRSLFGGIFFRHIHSFRRRRPLICRLPLNVCKQTGPHTSCLWRGGELKGPGVCLLDKMGAHLSISTHRPPPARALLICVAHVHTGARARCTQPPCLTLEHCFM